MLGMALVFGLMGGAYTLKNDSQILSQIISPFVHNKPVMAAGKSELTVCVTGAAG